MRVSEIRTKAKEIVGVALGPEFRSLPHQFNIALNDDRSLSAGYAVLWGSATQTFEVDQLVNLEQDVLVEITKRIFVRNSDEKTVSESEAVYDAIGTVLKRFILDKLDLPGVVQEVSLRSIEEPRFLNESSDVLSVRVIFSVRYLVL